MGDESGVSNLKNNSKLFKYSKKDCEMGSEEPAKALKM